MGFDKIPHDLRRDALFCCWKMEDGSKKPINPRTGAYASSNDPSTFAPFEVAALASGRYDGIGVGIFGNVCAIDIDHCFNAIDGMTDYARDIVTAMDSYTEVSPSGTGIRILFYASPEAFDKEMFYVHNRKQGIEVYVAGATNKYVTITGDYLCGTVAERTDALRYVLDRYMRRPVSAVSSTEGGESRLTDEQVKTKALRLYKTLDLWNGGLGDSPSNSEADLALCTTLAFWTNRDKAQIDRLFRESKRMRDKWDANRGAKTYGELTIDKAVSLCTTVYSPELFCSAPETRTDVQRMQQDFFPINNPRYEWTDIGAGALFADWYDGRVAYVPERKKWYVYNGRVWVAGNGEDIEAMNLLVELAGILKAYALMCIAEVPKSEEVPDGKKKKEKSVEELFLDWALKWQKRNFRETILKDARGKAMKSINDFDANAWQLNLQNGTLDLKSGEFHEHRAEDYHTMSANVSYDPSAKSERWISFVDEVMRGDAEAGAFIQKALGYSLTGDISQECMFMFYGATTRNGKSTLANTFAKMLGDYAKNCNPETISQKRTNSGGSGPSEDLARLRGARFVNVSEPDKRMVLSTALVKSLTGGNEVTARALNENSFQYYPTFKIFLDTNYLPASTDTTLFDSGRVHVIPFNRHFSEEEQDRGLKQLLASPENLSGVLNWCLDGYRALMADGGRFKPPVSVKEATSQYREDNDRVAAFMSDEMVKDMGLEVTLTDAYARYKLWCDARGYRPENSSAFKVGVEKNTLVVKKRPKGGSGKGATNIIVGWALRTNTDAAYQDRNSAAC